MLRIPKTRVIMEEIVCKECDCEQYVPSPANEVGYCYFCGKQTAWSNGELTMYPREKTQNDE